MLLVRVFELLQRTLCIIRQYYQRLDAHTNTHYYKASWAHVYVCVGTHACVQQWPLHGSCVNIGIAGDEQ